MNERKKKIRVDKEDIVCPQCNKSTEIIFRESPDSSFCNECCYELKKKDLTEEISITEILTYGFWLRFAHEHFTPCPKCQDKLDEALFRDCIWNIEEPIVIRLVVDFGEGGCYFIFEWLSVGRQFNQFNLCGSCEKELKDIIKNAYELTMGNKDYSPPVELWRRWQIKEN